MRVYELIGYMDKLIYEGGHHRVFCNEATGEHYKVLYTCQPGTCDLCKQKPIIEDAGMCVDWVGVH